METDIRYHEPSAPACEREMAASAEQWSNWTTNEIRSAIEAERERTFELLTELLVGIKKDLIPEVVATLPALRGPAGPVGPTGKLPIAKEWTRETVFYEGSVVTYDGGSYQALRDTGEPPDNEAHWRCLAAPGRDAKSIRHSCPLPSRRGGCSQSRAVLGRRCGLSRGRRVTARLFPSTQRSSDGPQFASPRQQAHQRAGHRAARWAFRAQVEAGEVSPWRIGARLACRHGVNIWRCASSPNADTKPISRSCVSTAFRMAARSRFGRRSFPATP